MQLSQAVDRVAAGENLASDVMAETIGEIIDGKAAAAEVIALLTALRNKGESVDEIVGAAEAMRQRARPFQVAGGVVVDTCGTGGDGKGSVNISTIAALVVASGGVKVAKHGNWAQSSRAGSADLLAALGLQVDAPLPSLERSLAKVGITFLLAPTFHPAMRQVAKIRRQMAARTIFNLLGPLTNPAKVAYQVVGVFDRQRVRQLAECLLRLGSKRALVVHGEGGFDEFAPSGASYVAELRDGTVAEYTLSPRDFGLTDLDPSGLAGGEPAENALRARAILGGETGAARNCVVMTAAATFCMAGQGDWSSNARRAEALLDDGSAAALLQRWVHSQERE